MEQYYVSEDKFGFRSGRGTRKVIIMILELRLDRKHNIIHKTSWFY